MAQQEHEESPARETDQELRGLGEGAESDQGEQGQQGTAENEGGDVTHPHRSAHQGREEDDKEGSEDLLTDDQLFVRHSVFPFRKNEG